MTSRLLPFLAAAALLPSAVWGQTVLLDEGTFAITISGRQAGTETFSIRRSGLGNDGAVLAHGVVTITGAGAREIRPVLQAVPTDGSTTLYEVNVTGQAPLEGQMALTGNRFVSEFRSAQGHEEREFLARPGTRVVDAMVAHHYYFLRGEREGAASRTIEPWTRRSVVLAVSAPVEEEISLGRNQVSARRVSFGTGSDLRTVWYDSQGRVLRVEIPALEYLAERTDLVG